MTKLKCKNTQAAFDSHGGSPSSVCRGKRGSAESFGVCGVVEQRRRRCGRGRRNMGFCKRADKTGGE